MDLSKLHCIIWSTIYMCIGISWIKGPHNYQYQEADSLNWGPEGKLCSAMQCYMLHCVTNICNAMWYMWQTYICLSHISHCLANVCHIYCRADNRAYICSAVQYMWQKFAVICQNMWQTLKHRYVNVNAQCVILKSKTTTCTYNMVQICCLPWAKCLITLCVSIIVILQSVTFVCAIFIYIHCLICCR